jgi:hypothetical protein
LNWPEVGFDRIEGSIDLVGVSHVAFNSKEFRSGWRRVVRNSDAVTKSSEMARASEANTLGSTCDENDS